MKRAAQPRLDQVRLVEDFDRFWTEYPKKRGRREAFEAWLRLGPSAELVEDILTAVRYWRTTWDWRKADESGQAGAFIPWPQKFLNKRRWEDPRPGDHPSPPTRPKDPPRPVSIMDWRFHRQGVLGRLLREDASLLGRDLQARDWLRIAYEVLLEVDTVPAWDPTEHPPADWRPTDLIERGLLRASGR